MRAYLGIETIAVHAEVERRVTETDDPGQHGARLPLRIVMVHRGSRGWSLTGSGRACALRDQPGLSERPRARYLAFRSRPNRKQSVLLRGTDTDPENSCHVPEHHADMQ